MSLYGKEAAKLSPLCWEQVENKQENSMAFVADRQ